MSSEEKELDIINKNSSKNFGNSLIIKMLSGIVIVSCLYFGTVFAIEKYQVYDFQKRYKDVPVGGVIETGKLNLPRSNHSCILLNDGNVLVVGGNRGAELYNPKTGRYKLIDKTLPEFNGSALNSIKLPNGNVLIAGYYIFDSNTYKFYTVNNVEKFIPNKILNYDSISPWITPISLSDKKLLIVIEYPSMNEPIIKLLLYDIDKNSYENFNLDIDKKYLAGRLVVIKEEGIIYFISNSNYGINITKWDYVNNQIIDIKNCSKESWQQSFIISDNNILLNDIDKVNNISKTAILDIENGNIKQINSLNKYIYSTINDNGKLYIFTSENDIKNNPVGNINVFSINTNELQKYDTEIVKDIYGYSYYFNIYNQQYIIRLNDENNSFLLSGGQIAIPKSSRIKKSVILKLI